MAGKVALRRKKQPWQKSAKTAFGTVKLRGGIRNVPKYTAPRLSRISKAGNGLSCGQIVLKGFRQAEMHPLPPQSAGLPERQQAFTKFLFLSCSYTGAALAPNHGEEQKAFREIADGGNVR